MKWFSSFILRRAGLVSVFGTLLAIVGGYYSVLLYQNLRTEIQELLPTTARSVLDLHEVSSRLESIDNLAVLVFSEEPKASQRFVVDLAKELDHVPKNIIASVDYRIDREIKFFKDRQALFMDLPDLIRVRNYIEERIDYEKQLYNPLTIFQELEIPEPRLDFQLLKQKYSGKTSDYDRLPQGFYATPDGKKRALLINLPGKAAGHEASVLLKTAVENAIHKLNPHSYSPDIVIQYTGGVEDALEEQAALVEDLEVSTVIVMIVVTVGMLIFYRSVRGTIALVSSLLMGTLWTFGVSFFVVGYLNANSAFLGSIVIGNGINFGIIFLARYLEERRNSHGPARAIRLAMVHSATSTWTAALAAGLSYGSLMLTDFRGFRQFGVIGLIGMVLCWISAFTLLPAFLLFAEKMGPLVKPQKKAPKPILTGMVANLIAKAPGTIWGASAILIALSLFSFTRANHGILETDLTKLRNKESMEKGSGYLSKYLDEIFQHFLSPLVVLPESRDKTREIAAALKKKMQLEGKKSLIASVQTLDDFLPAQQEEKIRVLKQIRRLLPPKFIKRLSSHDQKLVSSFLNPAVFSPFSERDLPPLVLRKFTEKDGSIGKLIIVEPPITNETRDAKNLIRFVAELRATADSIEPNTPVAGTMAITSDMMRAIAADGPKATLFAFLSVVVLVVVLFRNVKTIGLILFALILGVLWLAGLILGFDLKINFLNFIALPITFGIGVDYGVNIFQRYQESGDHNILSVIRHAGSAVALCSFSTIVGYTSLLIAGNQGFVSFGLLAVAGELTCVVAALVSLPALLRLIERRGSSPLGISK